MTITDGIAGIPNIDTGEDVDGTAWRYILGSAVYQKIST